MPEYRKIVAPLQGRHDQHAVSRDGQTISPLELPEFARDVINNDLNLRMGIGQIEQLARHCPPDDVVQLHPPGSQDLVVLMNRQQNLNGHLERLYWGVAPVVLDGVVEQVRTALTVMIAEIYANRPDGSDIPPAEVATNAINFAVTGKRNKISFAAPQGGSTVTTASQEQDEAGVRHWLKLVSRASRAGRHRRVGLRPDAGAGLAVLTTRQLPKYDQTRCAAHRLGNQGRFYPFFRRSCASTSAHRNRC